MDIGTWLELCENKNNLYKDLTTINPSIHKKLNKASFSAPLGRGTYSMPHFNLFKINGQ
jgi:hypothetical protein